MNNDKVLNKSLSIRISTNGLSFCTYSPDENKAFEYKKIDVQPTISLAANLKDALMKEPELKENYQRVNVMVVTPHTTCVPVEDFKPEDVETIYEFNFPDSENTHVSYNVLNRWGIAVIFGVSKNIHQLLIDDFPQARFYASLSTIIEHIGNKEKTSRKNKMYAYVLEHELTLYAFSNGTMRCFNTFQINSIDDCVYYILNMMQQLDFSQVDDSLLIVGNTGKEKDLHSKARSFVKDVSIIDCKEEFRNSITGGEASIPYDLQTLLICGF